VTRSGHLLIGIAMLAVACQPSASGVTPEPTQAITQPSASAPIGTPASTAGTPASTPEPSLPVAMTRPTNLPTDGSCEDENSSCLGVLKPNTTYASKVFKPTVTFTLPTTGWINQFDGGGDIGLQSLDPAGDAVTFFRNPRSTDKSVGTTVNDLAQWLGTNEDLAVTPFMPVKLGGLSGLVMDVRLAPGLTGNDSNCPVQACVTWMHGDDPVLNDPYQWHWDWGTAGPEAARLYLLTDRDGTVAVVIDSLDGTTFDSLLATWEKIAPTIKFG
jgi:hypothetical protein